MQENHEKSKNESNNNSSKKQKVNKNKKSFFSEHKTEFKKITWPNRKILVNQTITVIVISLIVGTIIFIYDFGLNYLFKGLTKIIV